MNNWLSYFWKTMCCQRQESDAQTSKLLKNAKEEQEANMRMRISARFETEPHVRTERFLRSIDSLESSSEDDSPQISIKLEKSLLLSKVYPLSVQKELRKC